MSQLVLSVLVVKSDRFERGLFIDLANLLDFLSLFFLLLAHHCVLAVELVHDVATLCLHLLSTFLSVHLTLFRDGGLSFELLFHRDLSGFGHTRVICLRLKLQLVNVEAAEAVGKLDLAALKELKVSVVVVDTEACKPLLLFVGLGIDFASLVSGSADGHQDIGQILGLDTLTRWTLHKLPHLFEECVVRPLRRHILGQKAHSGKD